MPSDLVAESVGGMRKVAKSRSFWIEKFYIISNMYNERDSGKGITSPDTTCASIYIIDLGKLCYTSMLACPVLSFVSNNNNANFQGCTFRTIQSIFPADNDQ